MLLREPTEAEDAAQQTFLSAYRSLRTGTEPQYPAAWLATIARNECWARIQQRMRQPMSERFTDEFVSPLPDPVDAAARRADLAALVVAIGALPAQQRDALVMREFAGMSYSELAAALSVSEPAVESLLVRARRDLRLRLQPVYAACLVPFVLVRDWFGRLGAGGEQGLATAAKVGAVPLAAKVAAGVTTLVLVGGAGVAGDGRAPSLRVPAAASVIGTKDAAAGVGQAGASAGEESARTGRREHADSDAVSERRGRSEVEAAGSEVEGGGDGEGLSRGSEREAQPGRPSSGARDDGGTERPGSAERGDQPPAQGSGSAPVAPGRGSDADHDDYEAGDGQAGDDPEDGKEVGDGGDDDEREDVTGEEAEGPGEAGGPDEGDEGGETGDDPDSEEGDDPAGGDEPDEPDE